MAAGKYNFTIEQGATLDFEIRYTDSNSVPVDLTGYTARMQIRQKKESTTPYISLSSTLNSYGTGLNMSGSAGDKSPVSGSIGVYIAAVDSALLNFSRAVYDLEIVSGSGDNAVVTRLLEGKIKLSKEVTR
jgi:hypothetical protein